MRKIIFHILILIGVAVAQFGLNRFISVAGFAPNIILIAVVCIGLLRGTLSGMMYGFILGLAWDVMTVDLFGSYSLLLTIIGYISGCLSNTWDETKTIPQVALVLGMSLVFIFGQELIRQSLSYDPFKIRIALINIIGVLYTMLVAPVVFAVVRVLFRRFD